MDNLPAVGIGSPAACVSLYAGSEFSFIPDVESSDLSESYVYQQTAQGESSDFVSVNPAAAQSSTQSTVAQASENSEPQVLRVCSYIWCAGMGLMLLYGTAGYIRMRLRMRDAVLLKDNIRQSEKVFSPFVMGFFRPQIYIPFSLKKKTRKQVLSHEQAHIKRLDHIWKPLGFVLLCVHWFNPLMWAAYILLCRDIEVACDEKVIRDYNLKARKAYAMALLECKMPRSLSPAYPLAFGEVSVGTRIKKTLRYKKPAVTIAVVAMVLTLSLSLCLLTDPVSAAESESPRFYSDDRVTLEYMSELEAQTEPATEVPTEPETEPETEPATEAAAEYYEDYYYDDYSDDYSEDYYYEDYEEPSAIMIEKPDLSYYAENSPYADAGNNYSLYSNKPLTPYYPGNNWITYNKYGHPETIRIFQ